MVNDTINVVRRGFRWLVAATVMLALALGGVSAYTYLNAQVTKDALCVLRHDLDKRVASSKTFLRDHPKGAFGFTPAQIQKSISDQDRTIHSLSTLSC